MERKIIEKSKKKMFLACGLFAVLSVMMLGASIMLGGSGLSRNVCLLLAALFITTLLREIRLGLRNTVLLYYDDAGVTPCGENEFLGLVPWDAISSVAHESVGSGKAYGDYLVLQLAQVDFLKKRMEDKTLLQRQLQNLKRIFFAREVEINITKAESPADICFTLTRLHLAQEKAMQIQNGMVLPLSVVRKQQSRGESME